METNACVFINRNEETKEGGMNGILKPVIDNLTVIFFCLILVFYFTDEWKCKRNPNLHTHK